MKVGDPIKTKVEIIEGDGCDMPRSLIASVGTVLQITQVHDDGVIAARHYGYVGKHLGFYLGPKEYTLLKCACLKQFTHRLNPCWCVPVMHSEGVCDVCGHDTNCHKHTDRFKDGLHRWVKMPFPSAGERCTRCDKTVFGVHDKMDATLKGCHAPEKLNDLPDRHITG